MGDMADWQIDNMLIPDDWEEMKWRRKYAAEILSKQKEKNNQKVVQKNRISKGKI